MLALAWEDAPRAQSYDVELNGAIVASGLRHGPVELRFGDGKPGFQEGVNTWRVRARSDGDERWSESSSFEVRPVGGIRARRFDHEDDGDLELTVRSRGAAALVVGSPFAFSKGKGVALRCVDPADAEAYKNELQQPVEQCWVRLAVRTERWGKDGERVHLARIRAEAAKVSEHLVWVAGRGLQASSAPSTTIPLATGAWVQVQLGVLPDGTVELWTFDGRREALVARSGNAGLAGPVKDVVSLGNDLTKTTSTFEVWLDAFAVGERRLPWAQAGAVAELARPRQLDPKALPAVFSFVFGSCNNPKQVPYRNTALGAAAASGPDFVVHLGDYGYPDRSAYRQSKAGYEALWSDLPYDEQLGKLFRKPWIYIASDHDLGGNDVDAKSLSPFASEAFASWQSNDPAADGKGRYGSVALDGGRVVLVWTEGIAYRSPLSQPDGPDKVVLGAKQKAWLLDLLATTKARLVIIASQTTIGHGSNSAWSQYPTEREEIIRTCQRSRALVRFISGDYHHALWARFGPRVAEWVAAPMAEFPEPEPLPAPLADHAAEASIGPGFESRPKALAGETLQQFDEAGSFGRVVIDTKAGTATFEVRDSLGRTRVDARGFRFEETVRYG